MCLWIFILLADICRVSTTWLVVTWLLVVLKEWAPLKSLRIMEILPGIQSSVQPFGYSHPTNRTNQYDTCFSKHSQLKPILYKHKYKQHNRVVAEMNIASSFYLCLLSGQAKKHMKPMLNFVLPSSKASADGFGVDMLDENWDGHQWRNHINHHMFFANTIWQCDLHEQIL